MDLNSYTVDLNNSLFYLNGGALKTTDGYGLYYNQGGTLSIVGNGTINGTDNGAFYLVGGIIENNTTYSKCHLSIGEDVSINGGSYVIWIDLWSRYYNYSNNVIVDIYGSINASEPIYVSGNVQGTSGNVPEINIKETANITCDKNGIYLAGYAKTTIENGATITNDSGNCISIAAGEIVVNGGTLTAASSKGTDEGGGGSISFEESSAIFIKQHTTNLPLKITINDGTFSAALPINQATGQNGDSAKPEDVSIVINGGNYNCTYANADKYCVKSADKTGFIKGGTYNIAPESNLIAVGYHYDLSTNSVLEDN